MTTANSALLAQTYQDARRELTHYLTRLVLRPAVAEELAQQAALRALETPAVPADAGGMRAWLFRVATNLAIDHLRRHSQWRETILLETRAAAEADGAFVAQSQQLRGSAEVSAIAREHLAVCFACALRNLPPSQAAALLLAEVFGITVEEAARILDASIGQTKAWIQAARAALRERYDATCALVTKQGVCHQCVELDAFFNGRRTDPLAGTARDVDARLAILRERRTTELGPWHRQLMGLVDALLESTPKE
jgi:RNA polymerase sigma-70 factor (ECF subfamily)